MLAGVAREIIHTDEFAAWFGELEERDQDAVAHVVDLLEIKWLALGDPYSSDLKGTKLPLRELKSKQHNRPLRVIYAFSPERDAVLLIGGDKTGNPRFYDEIIPIAEGIWRQYLRERAAVKSPKPRR
jgi:hypothetical protein